MEDDDLAAARQSYIDLDRIGPCDGGVGNRT